MTGPSDDADVVRELRARVAAGVPAMSLDGAAVRAAGRRRLSSQRWVAGGGAVAAALALAVMITTTGSSHPPDDIGPVGTMSSAPAAGLAGPPGPSAPSSSAASGTGGQADSVTRTVCFKNDLLRLGSLGGAKIADGLEFLPMAALGGQVFGEVYTAHGPGVGVYDTSSGTFTRIASYSATASGLDGMSADGHWVAWTEFDSVTDQGQWTMWAWNTQTKHLTELASSHPAGGGTAVGNIWTPVLVSGQSLIWTQQVGSAANSPLGEVRARDLESGTTRVLDRGQLSPPIRAGGLIIWSAVTQDVPGSSKELRAVSATTLEPATVPAGLQQSAALFAPSGTLNEIGVGGENDLSYHVYTVDGRLKSVLQLPGASSQFPDSSNAFQFVQLQGNHIIWHSPTGTILANLDSGVAVALPETASAFFVGSSLFVSFSPTQPASKFVIFTSNVALISWPIHDTEHC